MTSLAILLLLQGTIVGPPSQGSTVASPPQAQTAAGIPVPALCLTRTVVDADGRSQPFLIVVNPADATDLLASGFQVAGCSTANVDPGKYREIVCRVAAAPNEAVQNRYASLFGVRAKTLCATATALGDGLASILKGGK